MVELDAIEIGQPLVPVIRVLLHNPDFVLDPPDAAEGTRPGIDLDLAQIVVVVLESLLANDDVPAAGDRGHDEARRARLRQFELDSVFVARIYLADRREQDAARNADARRGLGDAIEGGLDILGSQLGTVA